MIGPYVIGRGDDCDIRIADEYASPRHAQFWQDDAGATWVQDLGSTNGVWIRRAAGVEHVSGWDKRPRRIGPGDVVTIGKTEMPWSG